MSQEVSAVLDRTTTHCSMCRRSVLMGEPLIPFHDPRADRQVAVCELCRGRARTRGWTEAGEPTRRRGGSRLRVEHVAPLQAAPAEQHAADITPTQA
ncbi:MAG: hypothetical protein JWM98_2289, partial [Thermoleophilia bacterium]|nr:hypothetical protein [Thermoleophilia bacterium]